MPTTAADCICLDGPSLCYPSCCLERTLHASHAVVRVVHFIRFDTTSSVMAKRHAVTKGFASMLLHGSCAVHINHRVEQEQGIVYVSPVSSNHEASSSSSQLTQ